MMGILVGRTLQLLGMANVALALYAGLWENAMAKEWIFLGIGVALFLAGRCLERVGRK